MYSAKARGKNRVERFDPARHGDVARQRTQQSHLGEAITRDEITLRFVPWIDPAAGSPPGPPCRSSEPGSATAASVHGDLLAPMVPTADLVAGRRSPSRA